jgi:riboflavin kinase / FMN adenylyltransferase
VRLAALGAFDGLHRGHMKVIEEAGPECGVVLLEPLPKQFFAAGEWRKRLTTVSERHELLRSNGINSIITLPFDSVTAGISPGGFAGLLADIGLFDGFVVGYDFRYGAKAAGDASSLEKDLADHRLSLRVVEPEGRGGVPVKSGRIRSLLLKGDLWEAFHLLGRFYGATGVVSRGRGFGRTLGFPTLNLRVPDSKLLPPAGSYAAFAGSGSARMPAAAFTVPEKRLVEVHIPGFQGDCYGASASVEFVSFLRKPEVFSTRAGLEKKISEDIGISMEVLKEWQ